MKAVSLRQMQHHLSEIIRQVDAGQEVLVTRRKRVIARLVPVSAPARKPKWPDFAARAARIRTEGEALSTTIVAEREK